MNYKEQLQKARENKLDIISLSVANEVECIFENALNEEEFELACYLVERAYLKSEDITIWAIAKALYNILINKENTISFEEKMNELAISELLEKACWY